MAHFARVQEGIVVEVLVVDQNLINSGALGDPAQWLQTSYNTRGGVYYTPNTTTPDPDQSKAFRKNYAGIGYAYDAGRDAFIPPQPFPSWVLDEQTCLWVAPVSMPNDGGFYGWDEQSMSWVTIDAPEKI